jgi:hypothetical protein
MECHCSRTPSRTPYTTHGIDECRVSVINASLTFAHNMYITQECWSSAGGIIAIYPIHDCAAKKISIDSIGPEPEKFYESLILPFMRGRHVSNASYIHNKVPHEGMLVGIREAAAAYWRRRTQQSFERCLTIVNAVTRLSPEMAHEIASYMAR